MSNSFIIVEDNLHRGVSLSAQLRTMALENMDINIKDVIILFYCDGNNAESQIKEMRSVYDFSKYNIRTVDIFSFEQIVNEYMEKDNNMIMICDYYLENDYSEGIPAKKPGIQYARKNRNYLQDDRIWIYTGQGSNTVKIIDELTSGHSIKMLFCDERRLTLNLLGNSKFINRLVTNRFKTLDVESMPKHEKCRYRVPNLHSRGEDGRNYCAVGARTLGEMYENKTEIDISQCENCENYKSKYIEYPLTIEKLNIRQPSAWGIQFKPVRVRLCEDNRTYFGILLGEFPWMTRASYSDDTGELEISTTTNPCILIPEINRVVFGAESWWGVIKPGEDISDITDDDIENVWYMKLLRSMDKEE